MPWQSQHHLNNNDRDSLSSPFMDGSSACGFFDIILGLFVEANIDATGKLVGKRSLSVFTTGTYTSN
jgi:hypothetical protein